MDKEILRALGFKKLGTEKADGFLVESYELLGRRWVYRRPDTDSNFEPKMPITDDYMETGESAPRQNIPLTSAEKDIADLVVKIVY